MSTNLPSKISDLVAWAATHTDLWVLNATDIGITVGEANGVKAAAEAMTLAVTAADVARQASKDATMTQTEAVRTFRTLAGSYINRIKGYAESTNDPGVYPLAGISPDGPPTTPPLPIPPTQFFASVNGDGSLNISFKVTQPAGVTGVVYQVFRRHGTAITPFESIGIAGRNKRITDTGLPVGVDKVEYMVQPQRSSGAVGAQSSIFTVQFGSVVGGGGGLAINRTTLVPHTVPMKVAA